MTILQIYNGDADAVSMLDELQFCYSKFLGDEKSQEETSDASDTLVEILLSFASKQSQLFRRMSEQVFGAFADKVTTLYYAFDDCRNFHIVISEPLYSVQGPFSRGTPHLIRP